jgi:ABC-type nitrate/sulfonate/bicarbonate transport system substrate-binding protein
MSKKPVIALVLIALLVAAGCAGAPATPKALQKVTVMLDWVPNTNHTGLYVALDKGWYRDQGLDVQIIQPGEGGTPVQVVAAGKAEFGISYQEETSLARAQDVPVVSIAAIIQHNTSSFAAPAAKGIKRPKDLEGKKYGAFGSPIEKAVLDVLMKCDGGDVNQVDFVDIGTSDFFVATQRDVDFAWIFDGWTGIEAGLRGVELTEVRLADWTNCLPDYYTPILVTGESLIARQPDLVKRFMAATSKGYQFAITNPKEAADILIKATPETNPKLVQESQAWLAKQYQADARRWGEQKLEIWKGYGDWMADRGLLPKRIDPAKAFTNQFLP